MKKKFIRLLACAVAVSAVLSMTACGSIFDNAFSKAETEVFGAEFIPTEKVNNDSKKYATVEEWLESDDADEEYKFMAKMGDDPDSEFGMKGEGNKLIITIRFDGLNMAIENDKVMEIFRAKLHKVLEEKWKETFNELLEDVKLMVDAEDIHVVARCVDTNGRVIVSEEFCR